MRSKAILLSSIVKGIARLNNYTYSIYPILSKKYAILRLNINGTNFNGHIQQLIIWAPSQQFRRLAFSTPTLPNIVPDESLRLLEVRIIILLLMSRLEQYHVSLKYYQDLLVNLWKTKTWARATWRGIGEDNLILTHNDCREGLSLGFYTVVWGFESRLDFIWLWAVISLIRLYRYTRRMVRLFFAPLWKGAIESSAAEVFNK